MTVEALPVLKRAGIRASRLILAAFLVAPAFTVPRAEESSPAPVAITDEPAHHLELTNASVRLFRVEVAPHGSTLQHRHDLDYVWIALGAADLTNAVRGKAPVRLTAADGSLHFAKGGFAHVAHNEAGSPFRNVTIELLRAQTGPRNLCEAVLADQPLHCPETEAAGASTSAARALTPRFETDQTRISALTVAAGSRFTLPPSPSPALLVGLEGTEADTIPATKSAGPSAMSGRRAMRAGDSLAVPAKTEVGIVASASSPARFLVLEFRGGE